MGKKLRKKFDTFTSLIVGKNPRTTICGYLLAGVIALQPYLIDHEISGQDKLVVATIAILVAILGRLSTDERHEHYEIPEEYDFGAEAQPTIVPEPEPEPVKKPKKAVKKKKVDKKA
jgi:hypothetical protein